MDENRLITGKCMDQQDALDTEQNNEIKEISL